jgi:hypothetical protein
LDYYAWHVPGQDGKPRLEVIAFGTDGTLWIEPEPYGIHPDDIPILARYGGPTILFDAKHRRVLINARAALEIWTDPEFRAKWLTYVESMIQEHREIRTRYESTRNN